MTEETAKALTAAIDRLITLLERTASSGGYGIHIYHHQVEPFRLAQPWASTPSWPTTTFERVAPAGGGHEESNPKTSSGASEGEA